MKIGIICECGPQGAETQVFPELSSKLGYNHQFDFATMSDKENLISGCGKAAAQLLASGSNRVGVIWDLKPAWPEKGGKLDCKKECKAILDALALERVNIRKVKLICIDKEMDVWLLCDGRGLSSVLSRSTHPVKIKDQKKPVSIHDPKGLLKKLFTMHGKPTYSDIVHAIQIVRALPDTNKLTRSQSFRRFHDFLK
jgi:hypothetical protein